ncbi:hypothetical protein [Streptomyces sp. NPDC051554]
MSHKIGGCASTGNPDNGALTEIACAESGSDDEGSGLRLGTAVVNSAV